MQGHAAKTRSWPTTLPGTGLSLIFRPAGRYGENQQSEAIGMRLNSIKFQVLLVLVIQIVVLLAIVASTLYLLRQRQHDYLILNMTGQLRVITQTLVRQSLNYVKYAPRDYVAYERDLGLYNADLQRQVAEFEMIIQSLQTRTYAVEPSDADSKSVVAATTPPPRFVTTLNMKWDTPSRVQLDEMVATWTGFQQGLQNALGSNAQEPRLEAAAEYILRQEETLTRSTAKLAREFRTLMENKLAQINLLNQVSIGVILLISVTIVAILYQRVFRPIDRTVAGFKRVANGELTHQIPVQSTSEIDVMTATFNHLTQRLAALFRLTDRINQATNLDETLRFAYEEFPAFLPIDWVGLLRANAETGNFGLYRFYSKQLFDLNEKEQYLFVGSIFEQTFRNGRPYYTSLTQTDHAVWQCDPFLQRLQRNQLVSVFFMPLTGSKFDTAMLVFASSQADSYNAEQLEFIANIAGQVGHGFEKTLGMETLVISTVKGLAKLAESRDPETGDHLFRMSHYSALVAEEMAHTEHYQALITPQYVRDILQFSPMHDIGKVGVSDSILLKPGRLDEQELKLMQVHPITGGQVLRRCEQQVNEAGLSVFQIGIEIAEGHHEKFDGSGYPHKLAGNAIPLSARIVAVADVFDALTSKRPYKEAWPVDKALELLHEQSGKHFDPEVIAAFIRALPRVLEIYARYKHV